MFELLQHPADLGRPWGLGPLAFYFEYDIAQSLHRDIILPLATAFAPVPINIGAVEQTATTPTGGPPTPFELQVNRPDRPLG
jgi:hypothetical protein